MVVLAGTSSTFECRAFTLSGTLQWSAITLSGGVDPGRTPHAAVYDSLRDRVVMFGGAQVTQLYVIYYDETWELRFNGDCCAEAALIAQDNRPPRRADHAAIHDPVRNRMIVSGGHDDIQVHADVWALDLADDHWEQLFPAGSLSPSRHTAVYDPVGDRMVVYPPHSGASVWELTLSTEPEAWHLLAPGGDPPSTPRAGHRAVLDPATAKMFVFGGTSEPIKNDVWSLSLAGSLAWSALGTVPPGAPARTNIRPSSTRSSTAW
jgi:hypothetical protein